jgi:CDP-paratose synthetase
MKAIITGASGYIGSELARKLIDEGREVLLILRPNSALTLIEDIKDKVKILFYEGHLPALIEDFKSFQADVVFHLASCFIAEHQSQQIDMLVDANIRFGLHILEAMKEAGISQLINAGTSWQYYQSKDYDPVCLYAATKKAFEDLAYFYFQAYGLSVINLLIYDTYGPRDPRKKLMYLFKQAEGAAPPIAMSAGEQKLDLVYIDDVLEAFVKASQNLKNSQAVFLSYAIRTQRLLTLKEIAKIYEEIKGVKLNIVWGERPYRKREVFKPPALPILPGWQALIDLETGLKK